MPPDAVSGVDQIIANMQEAAASQIPFAVSLAMNSTLKVVMQAESEHVSAVFDRPTPFTRDAFGMAPSTKQDLSASIFIKDAQAKYLGPEITGGIRGFKTFEERFAEAGAERVALPGAGLKVDQYGNITKEQIVRIAQELNTNATAKRYFRGVPKGHKLPDGIYARVNDNRKIVPLLVFATKASYQQTFKYSEVAKITFTDEFPRQFELAWDRAMRTMR